MTSPGVIIGTWWVMNGWPLTATVTSVVAACVGQEAAMDHRGEGEFRAGQ